MVTLPLRSVLDSFYGSPLGAERVSANSEGDIVEGESHALLDD